jgi:hypothetical protein
LGTRGDSITRDDLAIERWPAHRAEVNGDGVDELVIVSRGSGMEIVELVRRTIAARPAARPAARSVEPCPEAFGERNLDDAVVVEPMRERAQPRR